MQLFSQDWCKHWFVLQLCFDHFVVTPNLIRALTICLEGIVFRHWGSYRPGDGNCVYRILVYANPLGPGVLLLDAIYNRLFFFDFGEDVHILIDECQLVSFKCCIIYLRQVSSFLKKFITEADEERIVRAPGKESGNLWNVEHRVCSEPTIFFGDDNLLMLTLSYEVKSYLSLVRCILPSYNVVD